MKFVFNIIFILFYSFSFGQHWPVTDTLKRPAADTLLVQVQTNDSLRKDFMSDQDGAGGLRQKHTIINMNPYGSDETFFDGLNIIGKTKKELLRLLGPPNSIESGSYIYYISMCSYIIPKYGKQWSGTAVEIHLRFNVVKSITILMYCS